MQNNRDFTVVPVLVSILQNFFLTASLTLHWNKLDVCDLRGAILILESKFRTVWSLILWEGYWAWCSETFFWCPVDIKIPLVLKMNNITRT
jgi:hypothetical protein